MLAHTGTVFCDVFYTHPVHASHSATSTHARKHTHSLQSWPSASQVDTRHLYWAQSRLRPNNDARLLCRRQRRGAMVRAVLQGAPGLDLSHLAIGHATLTTSCLDRSPRHIPVKPRPFPATCYVTYRPLSTKRNRKLSYRRHC